jgi:hypothetical protein
MAKTFTEFKPDLVLHLARGGPDCEMLSCKGGEPLGIYLMRDSRFALAGYLCEEYSGRIKTPNSAGAAQAAAE